MPILQRAIELWYHDPACTTPVLKLMAELVHNRYEPPEAGVCVCVLLLPLRGCWCPVVLSPLRSGDAIKAAKGTGGRWCRFSREQNLNSSDISRLMTQTKRRDQ